MRFNNIIARIETAFTYNRNSEAIKHNSKIPDENRNRFICHFHFEIQRETFGTGYVCTKSVVQSEFTSCMIKDTTLYNVYSRPCSYSLNAYISGSSCLPVFFRAVGVHTRRKVSQS